MESREVPSAVLLIRQARALLIGSTVFWASSFPLMRSLELAQKEHTPNSPDAGTACLNMAVRFGLAALLLLPFYLRHLGNISFREWSQAIGLGLFAGIGLYLQTLGLAWTDASVSAFLTQLYTLIVPLIVAVRDRSAPSLRVIVACVLVLTGVAVLSPGLLTHFTLGPGSLIIILSTGFLACQIVWVERPLYVDNRSGLVTLLMFAIMSGIFFLAYFVSGGSAALAGQLFATPDVWGLMLALILFCTVINFWIMNAWQRCVSATEAGLIYCLEPVIATVISAFFPGWISRWAGIHYANEALSWTLLLGGAMILAATILVATEKRTAE
jgi:drug/metabolite transporter (DMT)-like permease